MYIYIYIDVCRPHLPVFLFSLHLHFIFYPIVYLVSAESLYKHSATTSCPEANLAHQGCLWQILEGPGVSSNSNKIHQKPDQSQHCDQSIRGPFVFYLRKLHFQCGRLWYRGNEPNWTRGVDAIAALRPNLTFLSEEWLFYRLARGVPKSVHALGSSTTWAVPLLCPRETTDIFGQFQAPLPHVRQQSWRGHQSGGTEHCLLELFELDLSGFIIQPIESSTKGQGLKKKPPRLTVPRTLQHMHD